MVLGSDMEKLAQISSRVSCEEGEGKVYECCVCESSRWSERFMYTDCLLPNNQNLSDGKYILQRVRVIIITYPPSNSVVLMSCLRN